MTVPAAGAWDAVVAGLGAMGSATARALAGRGLRVLGLDRFAPPHPHGSSHGRTRIIREAYFEHPLYVPLVRRAYECWAELEREAGRRLLLPTGGLMLGAAGGTLVAGARRSAEAHALAYELLEPGELRRRYPAVVPDADMVGLLEPRAGVLFVEACVEAMLAGARARGAELRFDEPVLEWRPEGAGIAVTTPRGTHHAARLVLAAGPWIQTLLADLDLPLVVERQLSHWFAPARNAESFSGERLPICVWEYAPDRIFYATPDTGHGLKAGVHHQGPAVSPGDVAPPRPEEEVEVRRLLARYLPGADGPLREARTCLYTNAPDGHFLIDRHPGHPQVWIVSACSGHGFKFASAIGEVLADLTLGRESGFDLTPFAFERLRRLPLA